MCRNLCIYKSFLPPTISFLYILKILKDPLSSFNIYKKLK